jgi:hypothetical protein
MPFLELFDETLDINSTANYELSVQLSPYGMAFAILDLIRNKFIMLRSYEPDDSKYLTKEKIAELAAADDFLNRKYSRVNLVLPSRKFTLVPAPLFDPAKKEDYFNFNHTNDGSLFLIVNRISDPDSFIVSGAEGYIVEAASELFPGIFPVHHSKPLLTQLANESRNSGRHYFHVHIEAEYFNLFIYEEAQMKFCNTFTYRNISDILYFVLNTLKNMGLQQIDKIHFSGHTEKYDDIYSAFSAYIKTLDFTLPSGSFSFSYVFNELGLHRFIYLFNITNCA